MTSTFLDLPQEVRDLILEHAISEDESFSELHPMPCECIIKPLPNANNVRWDWNCHYAPQSVSVSYLNLMLCNRQLNNEVRGFLEATQKHKGLQAKLTLMMGYPSVTPIWTRIPAPPCDISDLDVLLKIGTMYHPGYIGVAPRSAIVAAVFEILKRYIHRGPHLARPSALANQVKLDNVRITLAPPHPFSEMTHIYGFPKQQLETLFNEFKSTMVRLGRSGIPYGSIGAFEVRMEGGDWTRIPVTSNIWDEEDFVYASPSVILFITEYSC